MSSEPQYGLPSVRDNDGSLKAVDHTYQFNGEEVTIRLVPPTIAEMDAYEDMGSEVTFADLYEIVDTHLEQPDLGGVDDTSVTEVMCYLQGVMDAGAVGGTALAQDVAEALEEREGEPGN